MPLNVGGRLTGRAGKYSVGVLNIQTGDKEEEFGAPATNFSVVRVKRDVLRRSSIGLLFTNRSESTIGTGANRAYGIDGTFAFFENLQINTYWARTDTEGLGSRDNTSYRGQLDYIGRPLYRAARTPEDRRQLQSRGGLRPPRRHGARLRALQVQPASAAAAARSASTCTTPRSNTSRTAPAGSSRASARRSSRSSSRAPIASVVNYTNSFEFLPGAFLNRSARPAGRRYLSVRHVPGRLQHRPAAPWSSANLTAEFGTFYNGHKTTLSAARGRVPITNQLSVEPTYSFNQVTLDEGEFTTHLAGSRVTYSMTPLMFVSALLQYNSGNDAVSTNARFRWEYRPGSELFVVYNEERNTLDAAAFPASTTARSSSRSTDCFVFRATHASPLRCGVRRPCTAVLPTT